MKKLMAMIGAAVMSFGLFAALDPSVEFQTLRYKVADKGFEVGPTNIVGYDDASVKNVFTGGTVNWFADNFPTGDVGLVDYEQPAEVAEDGDAKVLKIEADTAYPMLRTFGPVQRTATSEGASYSKPTFDIGTLGLFADTKIKLSASEEAPQDFNGKIAVWLQVIPEDTTVEPATPGSTNLMVTCGAISSNYQVQDPTNIAIKAEGVNVNPEEWHQITIRTINTIAEGETIPGFVIYIDGKLAQATVEDYTAYALPSTDGTAADFAAKRALFASASKDAQTAQTLESVGFAGNGSLSYIDLTDAYNAPMFAVDPTEVLIKWDAHVASIIIDGEDITAGVDGYQVAYLVTNFNQTIEATVAYEPGTPGYRGKSITGTGFADDKFTALTDKMGFNFEVNQFREGAVVQVVSELDRDEALVTVDGDVKPMYSSLADALADINSTYKAASLVKIVLGEDVAIVSGKTLLNSFNKSGEIVIDLNGKIIDFTDATVGANAIMNNATLTIMDSSANGGGQMVATNGVNLALNGKNMVIQKATGANEIVMNGKIHNQNVYADGDWYTANLQILGGKFSEKVVCFCTADPIEDLPPDWEEHLNDGITLGTQAIPLKWSDAQTAGFWTLEFAGANLVVVDNEGVTFTFKTNNIPVAEGVKGVPLSSGMTAEIVATLKGHYEFADVEAAKAAGWAFTSEDTVATTNIAAIVEVGTGITVTIPATEQYEYAISVDGSIENGSVAIVGAPASGYVEVGATVAFTVTPDPGYAIETVTTNGTPIEAAEGAYSFEMPADDVVVSATFTLQTFTVTFVPNNGGENIVSNNVPYGTAFNNVKPADPEKTGYTFAGWDPADETITAAKTYTAQYTATEYTITFVSEEAGTTPPAATNYTVNTMFPMTLPDATFDGTGKTFVGWTNETITAATKSITDNPLANMTLYAAWEQGGTEPEPTKVISEDVDDTIPPEKAEDALANAAILVAAKGDAAGVKTWVATVYGEGNQIPGLKLANASAENVALAVANDLPITVEEPKFDVSASTVSEGTDNVAAFEFTLMDGTTPEQIKAITDKVKAMVRYTSALGTTEFHQAADTEVAITAQPVNGGKIKAELIKTAANAGFMKVEPQPAN